MKYTCDTCGTVYDEALGDPKRKVPAGTAFTDLPEQYACPLCGADKSSFFVMEQAATIQMNNTQEFWNNAKYSDAKGESQR